MSPHRDAVMELHDKGERPCSIQKRLNLSKGTVVGIIYRERFWQKFPPKLRQAKPAIFPKHVSSWISTEAFNKMTEISTDLNINWSETMRILIDAGIENFEE